MNYTNSAHHTPGTSEGRPFSYVASRVACNLPRQRVAFDGHVWVVLGMMDNIHTAALLLPIGGGSPRWLSSEEWARATAGVWA